MLNFPKTTYYSDSHVIIRVVLVPFFINWNYLKISQVSWRKISVVLSFATLHGLKKWKCLGKN
jgi:hypothetical protein